MINIRDTPKKVGREKIRYLLVGSCAFLLEYATFTALITSGINVIPANIVSFAAGLVISFSGQRYWAFRHPVKPYRKRISHQAVLFLCLALLNLVLSTTIIGALNIAGLKPFIAKVCVMVAIVLWNYFIFNRVIFLHEDPPISPPF